MLRHSPSSGGLHGFRQAQELALEMVEGIFSVIQRSPVGERIVGIKQNGVQGAGDGEDPRQAYRPQRLETVGVLDDFRLQRARRDRRAEAVRLNSVADRRIPVCGKSANDDCKIARVFSAAIIEERLRSG